MYEVSLKPVDLEVCDSDSPRESAEEKERGPAIISTGKKDERKGRKKDRDSRIVTVRSQVTPKDLEQ